MVNTDLDMSKYNTVFISINNAKAGKIQKLLKSIMIKLK